MFVLACKIQILSQTDMQITYNYVGDIKVLKSLDYFTDTCSNTVPRKQEYKGKDNNENQGLKIKPIKAAAIFTKT